jgi:hypothetical protein
VAAEEPDVLPARPPSAFGSRHAALGKDGRQLGGCTTEDYHDTYWTPARREEQRQKMLQLHVEGRAGGQNGFHRRRTKKFQEIAAEHAQEKADEIIEKLDAMIFGQHKDKRLQLEGIREYMRMEDWAVKNAREDEKEFRKLSGTQLDKRLLELMGDALGVDFSAFGEVVDAEVVPDDGPPRIEPPPSFDCYACDAEKDRVVELMRDSGVSDPDLLARTASLAACPEHRATEAQAA